MTRQRWSTRSKGAVTGRIHRLGRTKASDPTRRASARRHRSTERLAMEVLMVPHWSRSNRTLTVLGLSLVLAATLTSCGRGADAPPASSRAAADVAAPAPAPTPPPPAPPRELTWSRKVDMKLWSPGRVKAYKVALQRETPSTLAILRIPRLKLEVPVYD